MWQISLSTLCTIPQQNTQMQIQIQIEVQIPQVLLLLHPTKLLNCQTPPSLHPSTARLKIFHHDWPWLVTQNTVRLKNIMITKLPAPRSWGQLQRSRWSSLCRTCGGEHQWLAARWLSWLSWSVTRWFSWLSWSVARWLSWLWWSVTRWLSWSVARWLSWIRLVRRRLGRGS